MEEERLSNSPESTQALDWLLAFCNIGHDVGRPRPPRDRALHSRFLGFGGKVGYGLDPKRPPQTELPPDPLDALFGVERGWQEFRGVIKGYIRPRGTGVESWVPAKHEGPALTEKMVRDFLQEDPPRPTLALACATISPSGEIVPETLIALEQIQEVVRFALLEPQWYSHVLLAEEIAQLPSAESRKSKDIEQARDWYAEHEQEHALFGRLPEVLLRYAFRYCAGRDPVTREHLATPKQPVPFLRDEAAAGWTFGDLVDSWTWLIEWIVWNYRAPVRLEHRSGTLHAAHWDAESLPGLVWAEVLNAAFSVPSGQRALGDPVWTALRCCYWCGFYFWQDARPKGGRSRTFCQSKCRRAYHARGAGDLL